MAELRALKQNDLPSAYGDIAWMGLHTMRETGLIESGNLAAVSFATGTAIDKMRRLRRERRYHRDEAGESQVAGRNCRKLSYWDTAPMGQGV